MFRGSVLCLVALAVACGSELTTERTDVPLANEQSAPNEATSSTIAEAQQTTATPESSLRETPPSAEGEVDTPTRPESTLPLIEYSIPDDLQVSTVAIGDDHVVVSAWDGRNGEVLARADQPESAVSVSELFPSVDADLAPTISSIVWFRDRFYAFTIWDPTSDPSAPTVLTSTNGLEWQVGRMAVIAEAGLFFTPDSPADAEHAGVADAMVATSDGEPVGIAATGWGVRGGTLSPMLWETTDGETWRSTPLPNQGFESAAGFHVVSSSAGDMVYLGGPIHTGIGTVARHRPTDEWVNVPLTDEGFVAGIGSNNLYLYYLEAGINDGPLVLHWQEAGDDEWTTEPLPSDLIGQWNLTLEASSWHDPIIIERLDPGLVLWTLDRRQWSAESLEGDYLVTVTSEQIATVKDRTLYVYDRRWER